MQGYSQIGGWTPSMIDCYELNGICQDCPVGKLNINWWWSKGTHLEPLEDPIRGCHGWITVQKLLKRYGPPEQPIVERLVKTFSAYV